MIPPGGNFANGAVWYTIVFKVLTFYVFWPKTGLRATLVENPTLNPNINHYSWRAVFFRKTITVGLCVVVYLLYIVSILKSL